MSKLQTKIPTDTWVTASWDEYVEAIEDPAYKNSKSYYHNHQFRIEMSPLGNQHARDHLVIIGAITLFTVTKGIELDGRDNCSYRKTGYQEAQPDISFYIGKNADVIPPETSIIDLDIYPPPTLVIEVASSSLADDKGEKRLFYEDLNVAEYWIVDVKKAQIIAFAIGNGGSQRITQSKVLPGLAMSLLESALQRTRSATHSQVFSWLLTQFQQ
ncbi:MAG: Uma2 family endonuclease [Cyanobacteriota bacterium]|nr:Uma2 family endonuclease [Cyanobacteriota bacterium]